MSKKILIYGLAFGSACAAMSYLYYTTAIYKESFSVFIIYSLLESILLPALGIYMFVKAYRDTDPAKFTIGRSVFMGFMVSIIIGCSVSLLFSYLLKYKPYLINDMIDFRINGVKKAAVTMKKTPEELKNAIDNIKYSGNPTQQFLTQLFLGGSRGLFFSAIFAYFMQPKKNNPAS